MAILKLRSLCCNRWRSGLLRTPLALRFSQDFGEFGENLVALIGIFY